MYSASWVLKKAQSIPKIGNVARDLYNKPLLRIPRKLNELDSKTDILKGMYDKTSDIIRKFAKEKKLDYDELLLQLNDEAQKDSPIVREAQEYIKENLYKVSNKFFDKHTGNFNTAYERPLNRIVTGMIPVAFLANDAYNLSVLCGDDKETSKKEATERRKQEISRVFTTAYIQLLTFGAFTKQVNTNPLFTPITSALTVLFSETTSRMKLGKPIFFLSKQKAKEYNKRNAEKEGRTSEPKLAASPIKEKQVHTVKSKIDTSYTMMNEVAPSVFTSFKGSVGNSTNKGKAEESKKEAPKALMNFQTLKKGVIFLVSACFALNLVKNSSLTKNTKLVKGIQDLWKNITDKVYKPLAFKDFEISQADFQKVLQNLRDAGCSEIAEGHEFIMKKYGSISENGMIKIRKAVLKSDKIATIIEDVIPKLQDSGVEVSDEVIKKLSAALKTAVGLSEDSIAEMKYEGLAKKAVEIITKKKVDLSEEQKASLVENIVDSVKNNVEYKNIQMETRKKPFVDIVTQPFKFVMSAMRLPFDKVVTPIINLMTKSVTTKAAKEALGEAELNKFERIINRAVKELYGEKKAKSGKISQTIFANAMEQLEKQTKPYRMAEAAYNSAIERGASGAELAKAKEALDRAKEKLLIYVNTAVEKSFNGVTQSSNKNTDLAMMAKLASSTVTSAFLVADNYNMVMLKSDGEDTEGAKEKANERIVQRLSALFYQTLFINWFNATFRTTYNSSLKGMTSVAIPNTLTTEVLTRKSIGMPIGRKTYEQLQEIEEKNENRTGLAGKYFKFMRLLTGKKPLKDRLPKDKQNQSVKTTVSVVNSNSIIQAKSNSTTTNLLEMLTK